MLNLKKLLKELVEKVQSIIEKITEMQTSPQVVRIDGQPINGTFSIPAKPYTRVGLVVPHFVSINTFSFNVKMTATIPANTTSITLTNMFKNDGTQVNNSTQIDFFLILFRI